MPEPRQVGQRSEAELIARLEARHGATSPVVRQGIGDDSAVLTLPPKSLASIDSCVEGRHFDPGRMGWADIGWRAVSTALSDLAAMGGRPLVHLLAINMPASLREDDFTSLVDGLAEAAEHSASVLVGGNLGAAEAVSITTTVIGQASRPVGRTGGQVGDRLVVSGTLGLAALGREAILFGGVASEAARQAFLRPEPAWGAAALFSAGGASAMIDVTDGLALDLSRLLHPGASGADLRREALVAALGGDQSADLERALYGGDDYCLVAAVPESAWPKLQAEFSAKRLSLSSIGQLSREPGLRLDGQEIRVAGYDHFGGRRP